MCNIKYSNILQLCVKRKHINCLLQYRSAIICTITIHLQDVCIPIICMILLIISYFLWEDTCLDHKNDWIGVILTQQNLKINNRPHCYIKNQKTQLQPIHYVIYQTVNTISIKISPWKLISKICHIITNILLLVMVTMGIWSPCGLKNPLLCYVLIYILDNRVNTCTVSYILVELSLFIFLGSLHIMIVSYLAKVIHLLSLNTISHFLFQQFFIQ